MAKKMKSLKMFFRSLLTNLGSMNTDKGNLTWDADSELEVGMEVFIESTNEETGDVEYLVPENGEYTNEAGDVIVIADGKVEEIRKKESEDAPAEDVTADENLEGEDAPVDSIPATPVEDAPFDIENTVKAIAEQMQAMQQEIDDLKAQLNLLLQIPGDVSVFSKFNKQNKSDEKSFKGIFKVR